MSGYYSDKLSAQRLIECYKVAPTRVQQYLQAELNHVLQKVRPGDLTLELGCGYGRILKPLARKAKMVIGVDTSYASLLLGKEMLSSFSNCWLLNMNAVQLAFADQVFDKVVCIQNGISAFHVNQRDLIRESIRVTRPGGIIFFSSYSEKFWKYRLEWFEIQSQAGLLGEIDYDKTGDGVIVCKDGFSATTVSSEQFLALTNGFDVDMRIEEVGESSLFCEITTRKT